MSDETRNRLRAAYDGQAAARDARQPAPWKRDLREAFLDSLCRERCVRLLEIGCGAGHDGSFFAGEGLDVVCIDLSPEMVRCCRGKGLDALRMDACDLRFPDNSFDAVYSLNTFLHLPHTELPRGLREVGRVLRPDGLFFLGLYGGYEHEGVWEEDDCEPKRFFSFHTDAGLLEATGAVFDVVSFRRIDLEDSDPRIHFQSLMLRYRAKR